MHIRVRIDALHHCLGTTKKHTQCVHCVFRQKSCYHLQLCLTGNKLLKRLPGQTIKAQADSHFFTPTPAGLGACVPCKQQPKANHVCAVWSVILCVPPQSERIYKYIVPMPLFGLADECSACTKRILCIRTGLCNVYTV